MTDENSERVETAARKASRSVCSGLEQRVLARVGALALPARAPIIVGFSGGPDSLCLAAVLERISRSASIQPRLVHVDHRLRPTSDQDARRAGCLAREIGLPFEIRTLPSNLREIHPGVGIEEAARRERYAMLATSARECGTDVIATGHQQSDQAETVLLHLLRGAGLTGAAGMGQVSELSVPWWPGPEMPPTRIRVWRPLLDESRSTIDRYVAETGHSPILDESNEARDFRRNAIRHDILPVLERVFPGAKGALARFAEVARGEDELLSQLADRALSDALRAEGALDPAVLRSQPQALQRRVLVRWLRSQADASDISFDRVAAVLDLACARREGPVVEVVSDRSATVVGNRLVVGSPGELLEVAWALFPGPRIDSTAGLPAPLEPDRALRLERVLFWVGGDTGSGQGGAGQSTTIPPVSGALEVRRLRADDCWAADGKRVAGALRRERVPVLIRDRIVCVASGEGVLWVPGLQRSNRETREIDEATVVLSWKYVE